MSYHKNSGSFKKGQSPWNKGKRFEQIEGDKHPNWKGGITRYRQIMIREGIELTCQNCGSKNKIQIHHKDKNRSNNLVSNLMVLCSKCHANHHKNWEGRWGKKY